jgi:hypothetical protein
VLGEQLVQLIGGGGRDCRQEEEQQQRHGCGRAGSMGVSVGGPADWDAYLYLI